MQVCERGACAARIQRDRGQDGVVIRAADEGLVLDEEARPNPDAMEAVFRKLNADDEAETARRNLCG